MTVQKALQTFQDELLAELTQHPETPEFFFVFDDTHADDVIRFSTLNGPAKRRRYGFFGTRLARVAELGRDSIVGRTGFAQFKRTTLALTL
jgi:hypothetical protein